MINIKNSFVLIFFFTSLSLNCLAANKCSTLFNKKSNSTSIETKNNWLSKAQNEFNVPIHLPREQLRNVKLGDYMTPQGDIVLFRYIQGEYKKGYKSEYTVHESGVSYSVIPQENLFTAAAEQINGPVVKGVTQETVIVSLQNILRDSVHGRIPSGGAVRLNNVAIESTLLSWGWGELKVPLKRETAILTIPYSEYQNIFRSLPQEAVVGDLVDALFNSSFAKNEFSRSENIKNP